MTITELASNQVTWLDGTRHEIGWLVIDPDGFPCCANADLGLPIHKRRLLVRTWPEDGEAWPRYGELSVYLGDKANG